MDQAALKVVSTRKYEADEGGTSGWVELVCGDWTAIWVDQPSRGDDPADGFSLHNGSPLAERSLCYASMEGDLDELILLLTDLRDRREANKRGEEIA